MPLILALVVTQLASASDTAVVRVIAPTPSALDRVLMVAEIGAVLLAYVLVAGVVFAGLRARRSLDSARESLDAVGKDLKELADNANRISHSVTQMAETIRRDVDEVHSTVEYANRRARTAVTTLADRIDRFNDTVGVVQKDTENVVFAALSAIKGVRAGVAAMRGRRPKRGRPRSAARRDDDELDTPPDLPARPRLRRRAHGDD